MKRFSIFGMEVVPPWAAVAWPKTEGIHVQFFTGPDGENGDISLTLSDDAAKMLVEAIDLSLTKRGGK